MTRHLESGHRCAFETLEDRCMLAGNVTAQIVKGNLVIKGDNVDNQITITSTAVTGVGTMVNGGASFAIPASFAGSIKMDLKGGTDTATITSLPTNKKGLESEDTENVTN